MGTEGEGEVVGARGVRGPGGVDVEYDDYWIYSWDYLFRIPVYILYWALVVVR